MASGVCAPAQSAGPDPSAQGNNPGINGSDNGSNGSNGSTAANAGGNGQFDSAIRSATDAANQNGGNPAANGPQTTRIGDGATGSGRIGPDQGAATTGTPTPSTDTVTTASDTATGNTAGNDQPAATAPATIDVAALQANAPGIDPTTSGYLASIVNGTATPGQTTAGVQGLSDYLVSLAPTAATTDTAAATDALGSVMAGLTLARTDESNPLARLLVNEGTINFREATGQPIANADSADLYGGSPQLLGQWADSVGTQDSANYLNDFLSYLSSTDLALT